MQAAFVLNGFFGASFLFILIFADYRSKYNTDTFQRTLFTRVLVFSFIAIIMDGAFMFLAGREGPLVRSALYAVLSGYYFFQVAAFYSVALFFDYIAFKDMPRIRKIGRAVQAIYLAHAFILAANLSGGFYFFIPEGNQLVRGEAYAIRLIISYLPVLFIILDLFLSSSFLEKSQVYLCLFFITLTGTGSALDIILDKGTVLVWPCFSTALLYVYFFIIRGDSKTDGLTGIGNRYSFNEFIDKLVKSNVKNSYTIAMIDVDHFKRINDTLGHAEGDNALRDLASIIKSNIRQSDFAARYGGDEFVLAARAESDIQRLLDRIRDALRAQNDRNIRPYKIEISYGYDMFIPQSGQSITDFLKRIDSLMYKHKAERERRRQIDFSEERKR
jgi:diguanylate cyclase (GGDEF)-like protein